MEQITFDSSYLLIPATSWKTLRAVYLFNHSNCCHQSLEAVTGKMTTINSSMYIVPFSFVLPLAVTRCHLLSFVVSRRHSLSLAVTHCQSLYPSLLFLLLVVIRCHSLSHSLSSMYYSSVFL